jgi:hypothetical protein
MALCSGIRADGGRCQAQAIHGSQFCISHDPDKALERRRRNVKGGKRGGRGQRSYRVELGYIKAQLQDLADQVLEGSVNRADAAVVGQLQNIVIRAITTEMQVREQEELVGRLESLEAALEESEKRRGA